MSTKRYLSWLEPEELAEVYRHWAGEVGVPTGDESLVRTELERLMGDRDRVAQRFRDLPVRCREFLEWMLGQEEFTVPRSRLDDSTLDLPVKPFEVEAVAFALKKRGFLAEAKDLSWMRYDEPVYVVPETLGESLSASLGAARTLESQLSLRAFLRTLRREDLSVRLTHLGLDPELASDRGSLVKELARPEILERALDGLTGVPELREVASKCLYDHGGILEARHLERMGYHLDVEAARPVLEASLLGTFVDGELTDVGLQLGAGSMVIFLDVVRFVLLARLPATVEEEPPPSADVLADLAAVRTFLDHHSVRVTREGTLYRATRRKMETAILSPGARVVGEEDAVSWLLSFLSDQGLVRADSDGRMRNTKKWEEFDAKRPVQRAEALLTHVVNDLTDAKAGFHLPRLRRILLNQLKDAGASHWVSLRQLALLARNRYLLTLDRSATAERFQKRYKYAPIPPLAAPATLTRELVTFGAEGLTLAGLLEAVEPDEGPSAVRMTRLGAAVLGLTVEGRNNGQESALILTPDFEIILFPEMGGMDLVHEVARFARREKADYSLHYRISERTIQEAVAGGMSAEAIVNTLKRHSRHALPGNVVASITEWAGSVTVLSARRTMLLSAPSREALDQALTVKELRAIAGERLNDRVIELTEDASNPRVAEVLRAHGFFLR